MRQTLTLIMRIALSLFAIAGMLSRAAAQVGGPYVDMPASPIAINGGTGCGSPITRTINVPDSFIIGDLDLGFIASHAWRSDIRIDVTSPQSTTATILTGPQNSALDNYNIQLNDESGTPINTAPHNTNDNVFAAPYENNVQPNGALSAFDGEQAQGNWTIAICDTFTGADDGSYRRSELIFTEAPNGDLALTKTATDTTPGFGAPVTFTLTVTNEGGSTVTGIEVTDQLPSGLVYSSDSGGGSYNSTTGVWTVGSVAAFSTATLNITAYVNTSGSYVNTAEITASDQTDPDSTPNNGIASEDDQDSVTLSPTGGGGGIPPALSCGSSATVHDWNSNNWPSASLTQSYTTGGESLNMTFTGSTSRFANFGDNGLGVNPPLGPVTSNYYTGGYPTTDQSVLMPMDFAANTESITMTINIGVSGTGVSELQFTIFDADIGADNGDGTFSFEDQFVFSGSLNGSSVTPTITTGTANSASGTTVTGTGSSGSAQSAGNIVVTFTSAVDQVVFTYRPGPNSQANPNIQGTSLHDLRWCPVPNVTLTAVKTVSVIATDGVDAATCSAAADPGDNSQYPVPGACVQYQISVTHPGGGPSATDITLMDILPDDITYVNASQAVFTGGSISTTPATCTSATSSCTVQLNNATLASGATGTLTIRALVE